MGNLDAFCGNMRGGNVMQNDRNDVISRQAAIEAVSHGCQEWRGIFGRCEENILALPPAQPEIIRCRECKEWEMYGNGCQGWCEKLGLISYDDDYCGWAERREESE